MSHYSKDSRIAIIGAGAAGLAAAERLRARGYKNITIFEKTHRAGGQALTLRYKVDDQREVIYELGSMQPTGSPNLFKLFERYHLHLGKSPYANDLERVHTNYLKLYSFEQHKIIQDFEVNKIGFPLKKIVGGVGDTLKLAAILYRYRALFKPGFQLNQKQFTDLSIPFNQWVDNQHFKVIGNNLKMLGIAGTVGNPELSNENSALMVLKFICACITWRPSRVRFVNGVFKLVREGYQELWERVAKAHHVIFNANIEKIIRNDNKIDIHYNNKTEVFDALLVTCSFTEANKILDVTEEERNLFDKVKYNRGWRVAFLAKNLPVSGIYFFIEPFLNPSYLSCPLPGFIIEGEVGNGVWLYSSALSSTEADVPLEPMYKKIEDILHKEFKAEVVQWVGAAYWPEFFPHFDPDDVNNGIYQKINDLQSKKNTYYLGATLSSSMHAPVVDHAYAVVDQYF